MTPGAKRLAQGAGGVCVLLAGVVAVQTVAHRVRLGSATRVMLTDVARFEGCLFAGRVPPRESRSERLVALARGTGDHLWPHSCAQPLSRLQDTTEAIAEDTSRGSELHARTRTMDAALGAAVVWTEREQRGEDAPATWLVAYGEWHDAVEAFARGRGVAMPAVEVPAQPRRPLVASDAPPVPWVLPVGDDADVVDAAEARDHGAWMLFRDKHAALTLCHTVGVSFACAPWRLAANQRAEDLGFARGDGPALLVVRRAAPEETRDLVDVVTGERSVAGVATDRRLVVSLPAGTFVVARAPVPAGALHVIAPMRIAPLGDQCLAPLRTGVSERAVRSGFVHAQIERTYGPGELQTVDSPPELFRATLAHIAALAVYDDTGRRIRTVVRPAHVNGEVSAARAANPADSAAEVALGSWSWRITQDGAIETRRREPAPRSHEPFVPLAPRHRDGTPAGPQHGTLTLETGTRAFRVRTAHTTTAELSDDGGRTWRTLTAAP